MYRQIFTDGRALPTDPNPSLFVAETTGFNGKTWLDGIGHPHGERLRVIERFRRRDFGHLDLEITIDDEEFYEKPWTVKVVLELAPDTELLEDVCLENERSVPHMIGKQRSMRTLAALIGAVVCAAALYAQDSMIDIGGWHLHLSCTWTHAVSKWTPGSGSEGRRRLCVTGARPVLG